MTNPDERRYVVDVHQRDSWRRLGLVSDSTTYDDALRIARERAVSLKRSHRLVRVR